MIMVNEYEDMKTISKKDYRILLHLLNPIAPHITEELNEICNLGEVLSTSPWPTYDEEKTISNEIEIGVQVNGKLRGAIKITKDAPKEEVESIALAEENVKKYTQDKEIMKVIVVPNRIVNIVVKG